MPDNRDGRAVEVSARTRTIPAAIRRALHHRDRGCRFPGCGIRVGEGHHIRHWAHGGPTTLSNLTVLCRRHHRAEHEFRRPDGRLLLYVPPRPRVPERPVDALRAANDAHGLVLDAQTATPGWLGEPLNVTYAIDVLH